MVIILILNPTLVINSIETHYCHAAKKTGMSPHAYIYGKKENAIFTHLWLHGKMLVVKVLFTFCIISAIYWPPP